MAGLLILLAEFLIPALILWGIVLAYLQIKERKKTKAILLENQDLIARKNNRYKNPVSSYKEDFLAILNPRLTLLPEESIVHINTIIETIDFMTEKNQAGSISQQDRTAMADIVYKHIPDTLQQLDEIPTQLLNQKNNENKNPKGIVLENLSLLAKKANEVKQNLLDENITTLKAQQNHIKAKFGQPIIEKEINS